MLVLSYYMKLSNEASSLFQNSIVSDMIFLIVSFSGMFCGLCLKINNLKKVINVEKI